MPVLNGIEAVRIVSSHDGSMPIVALSADEQKDTKELSISTEILSFIHKPPAAERIRNKKSKFTQALGDGVHPWYKTL